MYNLASNYIGRGGKYFIDYYNKNINPLPRYYRMKYNDSWCACFISCLFHMQGYKNSNYFECSCQYLYNNLIKLGYRSDLFDVKVNDIVFYNWNGKGYLKHVGIVSNVNDDYITVIEGNKNNKVGSRLINIHSKYIAKIVHMRLSNSDVCNTKINYKKLAREVIQGLYGNGITNRYANIKKVYNNFTMQDMYKIQSIVNTQFKDI